MADFAVDHTCRNMDMGPWHQHHANKFSISVQGKVAGTNDEFPTLQHYADMLYVSRPQTTVSCTTVSERTVAHFMERGAYEHSWQAKEASLWAFMASNFMEQVLSSWHGMYSTSSNISQRNRGSQTEIRRQIQSNPHQPHTKYCPRFIEIG